MPQALFPRRNARWQMQQRHIHVHPPAPSTQCHGTRPSSSRAAGITRHVGAPGEISMSMRMLIDARHPEETRVAVVKGNRIEEFDFESAEHKKLTGNMYLAKVTG